MSPGDAREAFEALVGLLPEAVLLVSSEGRVLSSNPPATRMLGRSPGELAGCRLEDLVLEGPERVADLLRLGSRSRALVPARLTFTGPGGSATPHRCAVGLLQPRTDTGPASILFRFPPEDGEAERFTALNLRIEELNREILRRQRAEAAVIEQREWLRVTLASIGDAVIATDHAGGVALMNAVAEHLTGWSEAEASGRPLDEVFVIANEATGERIDSPVAQVMREGRAVGLANHTLLLPRHGGRVPIDDSAAPIRDAERRIHGVVLVFRDVTERRARELERVETERRKDEFLAMLGHELRNPLAVLSSGIQVLRLAESGRAGVGSDETLTRMGASMERQVRQLTRLVDDLLDVSRIATGKIALRLEPTSLQTVIEDAVESLAPVLGERKTDLRLDCEALLVHGDRQRLAQVFGNLLSNAIKFSPPGARVWVRSASEGGAAVVRVRDEGAGIAPDMLEAVFDLFTQADSTLGRPEGGLGVGLTVARLITQQHGGRIEARSEGRGRGSEFVVRLPLAPSPADAQQGSAPDQPVARSRHVLIVDDNADAAHSLALLLQLSGHDVQTALDGPTALALVEKRPPDVVLLDLGMPGMDGYDVARRLRGLSGTRNATIVAITGYGGEDHRRRSRDAGFDHLLTKPVRLEALKRLLEEG